MKYLIEYDLKKETYVIYDMKNKDEGCEPIAVTGLSIKQVDNILGNLLLLLKTAEE